MSCCPACVAYLAAIWLGREFGSLSLLDHLGFTAFFRAQWESIQHEHAGLMPARVVADSGDIVHIMGHGAGTEVGTATLSGRLRHDGHNGLPARPITGDWVLVENGVIHQILDRRTTLRRRGVRGGGAQVIAANVDVYFVVTSANRDLNPRRLERYISAVWDSGARPVVVLNKVDLVDDIAPLIHEIEAVAPAVTVVGVSASIS